VCGDSHTSTHGAIGALAFGIGTNEVEHVMATQSLLERKSKNFRVDFDGRLQPGVTAKVMVLKLFAGIGVGGGTGHVLEYTGTGISDLDMEGRMTICNMSIEAGARAGLVAPDQTTYDYVAGRPYAPSGPDWDRAMEHWAALSSDDQAH
jgi:3-isopropylmalate/(R)-2-methylmalate dehydratase large subunit